MDGMMDMGISCMNVYFYLSVAGRRQCRVLNAGWDMEMEGLGVRGAIIIRGFECVQIYVGTRLHTARVEDGMTMIGTERPRCGAGHEIFCLLRQQMP
jgi:hypothetical protein